MATAYPAPQPSYPASYPNSHTASNHSYPYTIPQSHYQTPQSHHPSWSPRKDTSPCVRRWILAVFLSFAMIMIISIITWLILHPHVPIFRVDSLSVSNFTLSNSQVTANYGIEFTVTNPNQKIDLQFGDITIFVSYKRNKLSRALIHHPFYLRKMNQTRLSTELGTNSSSKIPIKQSTANDMGRELSQKMVSLNVRMVVCADFKAGHWLSKQRSMTVFCENLQVGFSSENVTGTGRLINGTKDCLVHLL